MNMIKLIQKGLSDLGADGLWCEGCDGPCGCAINDLAPCGGESILSCRPAILDDGLFYPMEET